MNKENYEECFDRLDKYVFSRDMAVKDDWYYLLNYHRKQLQAYKEKEKEIRRICKAQKRVANTFIKAEKDFIYHNTIGEDILQILNEEVE